MTWAGSRLARSKWAERGALWSVASQGAELVKANDVGASGLWPSFHTQQEHLTESSRQSGLSQERNQRCQRDPLCRLGAGLTRGSREIDVPSEGSLLSKSSSAAGVLRAWIRPGLRLVVVRWRKRTVKRAAMARTVAADRAATNRHSLMRVLKVTVRVPMSPVTRSRRSCRVG